MRRREKSSLFPDAFCADCPRIQAQLFSAKSYLQEKQERMEYPEGTQSSASICICVKALKPFLKMSLFPPVPGTNRGILSTFPSLHTSAITFSSSEQYHGDLFQQREKFKKKIHIYTKLKSFFLCYQRFPLTLLGADAAAMCLSLCHLKKNKQIYKKSGQKYALDEK